MTVSEIVSFVAKHAPEVSKSKVVYSVLFGNHDVLPNIQEDEGVEFIVFTDNPASIDPPWRAVFVDSTIHGARRSGRYLKCLAHYLFPGVEKCLYMDASFKLINPLRRFLKDYHGLRFAIFIHPDRHDILEESIACAKANKEDAQTLQKQVAYYRLNGLPNPSGCYATGILLRNLTDPAVMSINETWCAELATWSTRDQISLPYVFWVSSFRPDIILDNIFYNKYLVPRAHSSDSYIARFRRNLGIRAYQCGGKISGFGFRRNAS